MHEQHTITGGDLAVGFAPRGPLSAALMRELAQADTSAASVGFLVEHAARAIAMSPDVIEDDDIQITLFVLYALSYGSVPAHSAVWEWHPVLVQVRARLEEVFESALRARVEVAASPEAASERIAEALFAMTAPEPGPSLARYVEKRATGDQLREFLVQRSIYTLREADPHSWAIPRLTGAAKAALVEIQSDEYGGGRADRMHSALYATAMRGADLDDTYGAYVDLVPAITLASQNMMSMFGLNRRLLGAVVGHLAAFEMTSSLPNRRYADGMRRLGCGPDVTDYFDEHVEADAVHEQIAGRDLAGTLGEEKPHLVPDIMFGAAACLAVDGWAADHIRHAWEAGQSSLRSPLESRNAP